jgi:chromosomal replication initiator protein
MLQTAESNLKAHLDGLFCRIDISTGRTICRTVPLDFIPSYASNAKKKSHRLDKLILVVASIFSISIDDIRSSSRTDNLVLARQLIVWVARQKLNLSFETIGLAIGRHHTTAMDHFVTMKQTFKNRANVISAIYTQLDAMKS